MGVPAVALPHSCGWLAQPFDPFFEQVGSCQHPLVGLPGLQQVSAVTGVIILWSSLWDLLSVVGSAFLISYLASAAPFFCWRCSSTEGTGCPGLTPVPTLAHMVGSPGSLFTWYTSLYSPLISPWEILYPMSWTVGTSTLGSSPGVPCQ